MCNYVHMYMYVCAYVHVCAEYAYGYVIVYVYNIFVHEHVYTRICAYVHIYIDDRCTCLVELVFFNYWETASQAKVGRQRCGSCQVWHWLHLQKGIETRKSQPGCWLMGLTKKNGHVKQQRSNEIYDQ